MRQDLLALDDDDLVALSNRGTLKRARRELDRGELRGELLEDEDGRLEIRWSDGVVCTIPADGTLADGTCTSGAVGSGTSRALIRGVLLYQETARSERGDPEGRQGGAGESAAGESTESEATEPLTTVPAGEPGPWDPGTIDDEQLQAIFDARMLGRERRAVAKEEAVLLVRCAKPTARFFLRPCFVRFSVPGDPRYARCSCQKDPCPSVARAVWAFRRLPAQRPSGLVSRMPPGEPLPPALAELIDENMDEFWRLGLGSVQDPFLRALDRLTARVRAAGLVWPAEILAELQNEVSRYRKDDARFDPSAPARLVAELDIRLAALAGGSSKDRRSPEERRSEVPEILIRGSRLDRETRLERASLRGLGAEVLALERADAVELVVYAQLAQSGDVVALRRRFANPEDGPPRDYATLASTTIRRGVDLAALAAGRTVALGLTLDAGRHLRFGRQSLESHPPAWREISDPVRAESFEEIGSRLAQRPPRTLGPRRAGEDLFVCELSGVSDAGFAPAAQSTFARLHDGSGGVATLVHPYTERGRRGHDRLLRLLESTPGAVEAVAGRFIARLGGLELRPTALFTRAGIVLPWIDGGEDRESGDGGVGGATATTDLLTDMSDRPDRPDRPAPHVHLLEDSGALLDDLCRVGLARAAATERGAWLELEKRWRAWESRLFLPAVGEIRRTLDRLAASRSAGAGEGVRAARRLAVLLALAEDGHGV